MGKTYRSITYRYGGITPWTNESDCYGFANVKGECWHYKKERGKQAIEPWWFEKNVAKLNGQKLKHYCKRDRKPWHKPPRWFKQMREQQFRSKTKQAIFNELMTGDGNFPLYIKNDIYNWD